MHKWDGNLSASSCLFCSEQEDPRLRIPVQQRRRGSLDPNDLGPLPVRSLIVLSLPCCLSKAHRFFFKSSVWLLATRYVHAFKKKYTECLTQSKLTSQQRTIKGLQHCVFFFSSLVGRRGSTAMGGFFTLITVCSTNQA